MKKQMLFYLTILALAGSARASINVYTVNNLSATIPDNDLNGYQNSQTIGGLSGPMTDVTVSLNITGGFNGDLYIYLYHDNTLAMLLNRVGLSASNGVGYPNTGFDITLDDQAANDVHFYQAFPYTLNGSGQLTGPWQPDGRLIDPLSPGSAFPGATRSNVLNVFDGMDPNGSWTLFAADVSSGGISTLQGWGLAITTVPEPTCAALIGLGLAYGLCRKPVRRGTGADLGRNVGPTP
jgi:subtilisin-like proprotein convertase family protein